jgi:predicted amidohydrolase YtcJ
MIDERSTQPPALLIVNARVRTADSARPWADAVLIVAGRIEAVGTSAELRKRRSRDVSVLDAKGRTLLPSSDGGRLARGQPASLVLLAHPPDGAEEGVQATDVIFELSDGRIVHDRDSLAG